MSSHTPVSVGQAVAADNAQAIRHDAELLADDTWSLAECHPRCKNCLPARYHDMLPQTPLLPIAVWDFIPGSSVEPLESPSTTSGHLPLGSALLVHTFCFFTTLANSFGLSHWYYGDHLLTHGPEGTMTLHDLTLTPPTMEDHISGCLDESKKSQLFYPYLNRSSFLLGDWYWNGGIQKSK